MIKANRFHCLRSINIYIAVESELSISSNNGHFQHSNDALMINSLNGLSGFRTL